MKKVDLYVANLAVEYIKLHNLHWNIKGKQFVQVHEYLEELYDDVTEKLDEVAELQKMLGSYPKASLKDYLDTSDVEELESRDYTIDEALEIVLSDLEKFDALAREIRECADEKDKFEIVMMMEDHIAYYAKQLWFVRSMLSK